MATVRDDDVGGDGRDDDESVSRGGTPRPLSDGSGATPGGGAASSEASEASERAGASGTRDETTGDDGDGGGGSEDAHRDDSEAGVPPPGKPNKRRGAPRHGRQRREGRNAGEGAGSIEPR